MKKLKLLPFFIGTMIFLQAISSVYGQNKFVKSKSQITTIKKLITAVQAAPNNINAHEAFINALNINDPILANQYMLWMKRFPKSAIVPFELGKTFLDHREPEDEKYLLQAVALDSTLADAWKYLSKNATLMGNKSAALDYMRKAALYDPKNAETAFSYAYLNRDGDQAKYDSLMLAVVYHFPESEQGAQALNRLAGIAFNANEKTAYYDALYQMYSKTQFAWFRYGMADYYSYLLNTSPEKAFDLALKMLLQVKINRGDWKQMLAVARSFVEARKLMNDNKPLDAAAILKKIDLGNSKIDGTTIDAEETLTLFKAEAADKSKNIQAAFDSLSAYYSKLPSMAVRTALLGYGAKLGLDSNKVDSGIWVLRNNAAMGKTNFTLQNIIDHKPVSISDFAGKVTLLTFWSPGCFPCREEFPHFQAVLNRLKGDSVAYIAIDVDNVQEEYVLPFMKANNYTFTSLRDEPNETKGNLPQITSIPSSFLIDQQGRVIFSDFKITSTNERTLERMITELQKFGKINNQQPKIPDNQPVDNSVLASKNK